ncbi:MAG: heavy metal translocating P-type ATPase, partial [Candidatus Sedimenticola sp. (ex Thyasira tokunagai)]
IQCVADRIVPWFVAATIGLATATFLWWLGSDFEKALMAATAVLIITCPCAFGLATPMSIAVASGLSARYGILVKNGEVLETLSSINHFVFDKTGTLTEGRMTVTSITTAEHQWLHGNPVSEEIGLLLKDLIALERFSEHPVAAAIISCGETLGLDGRDLDVVNFTNRPGFGVSARVAGHNLVAGNGAWLDELGVKRQPQLEQEADRLDSNGIGSLRCAIDGCELAVIGVEDRIREDAADLIAKLKGEGMQLTVLSGDRRHTAEVIARRLGGMEVIAEVLPEEKDQVIGELQAGGHKVAMVGDGVNDAPALVRADVGIALGSGTDVSIASADIVLMSSELEKVHLAAALSRRTLRTIRQNIGISITYNLIMVPLAMAAFITPLVAAVSMPVSSLLVIANAARIRTLFRGIR